MGSVVKANIKKMLHITASLTDYDDAIDLFIAQIAGEASNVTGATIDTATCTSAEEHAISLGVMALTVECMRTGDSAGMNFSIEGISLNPDSNERSRGYTWGYLAAVKKLPKTITDRYYVYSG